MKLFLDLLMYPEVSLYIHIITKLFIKKKKDMVIQTQRDLPFLSTRIGKV